MDEFPVLVHGRAASEDFSAILALFRLFLALVDDPDVRAQSSGVGQALAAKVARDPEGEGLLGVRIVFPVIKGGIICLLF